MSVAIRKRSWEEHVTQQTEQPFISDEYDIACHHGLASDSLEGRMEKDATLNVDHKEKCASPPDRCCGSETRDFPGRPMGHIAQEVDESDSQEGEERFLSLEASTETLVHISDEDTDSDLNLINDSQILTPQRHERDSQDSVKGAGSFMKTLSTMQSSQDSHNTWRMAGKADMSPAEGSGERKDVEAISKSLELCKNTSADETKDVPIGNTFQSLNTEDDVTPKTLLLDSSVLIEDVTPETQLLDSAVITQQCRKSDFPKDDQENNRHHVLEEDVLAAPYVDRGLPLLKADCGSSLLQPPSCPSGMSAENDLEKSGFSEYQNKSTLGVSREDGMQCLHLRGPVTTQETVDNQVRLRKRKETREDRDRTRLDSMVLLIMKLDQLDQDIENALSTASSPSSTPTNLRRHVPDLESGSESRTDSMAVNQTQVNLSSESTDPSSTPGSNSGTKPKAMAVPCVGEKEMAEIEAKEACDWLRVTGFPQYAQLYEDLLFPVDIALVKREHDFLDRDAIEALCRRLNTLNKCAVMKLEISPHRKRSEDSDEDEPCAISGKWTFQRDSKRWSRLEEFDVFFPKQDPIPGSPDNSRLQSATSHESMLTDLSEHQEVASVRSLSSTSSSVPTHAAHSGDATTPRTNSVISVCSSGHFVGNDDSFSSLPSPKELSSFSFSMKGHHEKNTKSKTRSLLKRMESLKLKGSHHSKHKAPSKLGLIISAPILQEGMDEAKLKQLNCVEISALNGNHINVPMVRKRSVSNSTQTSSSSSQSETSSAVSTPSPVTRTRSLSTCNKRVGMYLEGFDPFSQSTLNNVTEQNYKNRESYPEDTVFYIPEDHKPGTFPKALSHGSFCPSGNSSVNWRTGSFHGPGHLSLRRENSHDSPKELKRRNSSSSLSSRLSIYDNVPGSILYSSSGELADLENEDIFPELDDILYHVKGMQRIVNQWSEKFSDEGDSDSALDSVSPCPSSPKQIHLDVDHDRRTPSDLDSTGNSLNEPEEPTDIPERRDSGVGASLTRCNRHRLRWHSFQSSHRPSLNSVSLQINCQSVAQMNLLQKYSLLKLTALLEKYTPSNKHGFSWAVPKFMKRIKVPDYKDRSVFGVPLTVNVQRSGQPLPQSIQQAMRYLRNHCLDQVGLFRKSGVKSRIQALRQMNESAEDNVNYEGQSAYDVADMLKQYFRDLPEPLMTNKLSETFLQIYQYVPKDQRLQAIKAAIMLLPDENREVLQTLLYFLSDVTAAVKENQMTPTNLAVCLAPSLFHLNTLKRENSSPRVMQRKQSLGKPDQKDLNENLAATQGLAHMIAECKKLFQVPEEMSRCRNSYTEQELKPLTLEALGHLNSDQPADYRHFLQDCVDGLFKEVKEKFKGWVSYPTSEQADLSYKKVSEGPPLRLWRSTIEVPAAPEEILKRLLKEQHLWDVDLLDSKVIEILDSQTEIYQYVQNSMAPHPARDYVVLSRQFEYFQDHCAFSNPFWKDEGSASPFPLDSLASRKPFSPKDKEVPIGHKSLTQCSLDYICEKLEHLHSAETQDPLGDLSMQDPYAGDTVSFVPHSLFRSQPRAGWSFMLRIPEKKNMMSSRQWGPIFLKVLPGGILQMYYEKGLEKPFKEFQLDPHCRLSEPKLENFSMAGKIHTVKVEHVSYSEKRKYHAKTEVVHEPEVEQMLKLGSTEHRDFLEFLTTVEEELIKLPATAKPKNKSYEEQEICLDIQDSLWGKVTKEGQLVESAVVTQICCLCFLNGPAECFLALNDRELQKRDECYFEKEPEKKGIAILDYHFHTCVKAEEFEQSRIIKFVPLDACRFELMRFKTSYEAGELPFAVKSVVTVQGAYVELQAFVNMTPAAQGSPHAGALRSCNNIMIHFPVPAQWIKALWTRNLQRQKSLKAKMNRRACLGSLQEPESEPVIQVTVGSAKYESAYRAVVWKIDRLPDKNSSPDQPHCLSYKLELGSDQEVPSDWYPFATVQFSMLEACASRTEVRSLGVESDAQPQKHVCQRACYNIQVEIEKKWIQVDGEDADKTGGCVTQ